MDSPPIRCTLASGPKERETSCLTVSTASAPSLISIKRFPCWVLHILAIDSPVTIGFTELLTVLGSSGNSSAPLDTMIANGLLRGCFFESSGLLCAPAFGSRGPVGGAIFAFSDWGLLLFLVTSAQDPATDFEFLLGGGVL